MLRHHSHSTSRLRLPLLLMTRKASSKTSSKTT
nr:MAG TPA: hypothetical protein [Caudoviricetes sp.]